MSKNMKFFRVGSLVLMVATVLTACGGGGGSAAIPLTPSTQAPVANGVAGDIRTSVTIPSGSSTLALAQTNQNTNVSNASASNGSLTSVLNRLASFFIKPAYAQSSSRCVTDALKLVGIQSDGTMSEIPVVEGSEVCDVGFREMYDAGNYVLLTGEGLYKGDLTCNLVFLQKASGKLFCVGESVPSRYIINTATSSSSSSTPSVNAGGQTSPAAQKIQVVKNSTDNTVTDYMLIAAESMSFDTNGQINGKKIKLLRFNLKDLEAGPTVQLLAEGLEQTWMQQADTNDNLSFTLENYKIARNGDVFAIYSYYLWTRNPWSSTQRRNVTFFTYDSRDVVTKKSVRANDIQAIVDAQSQANQTLASGNTTGYSASYWYSIPCMFDDPDTPDGVLFTVPYSRWENTVQGVNSYQSSWKQSSYLIRASGQGVSTNAVITGVKPTQLCADTNGWSGNAPVRVIHPTTGKDIWFSLQKAWINGYDSAGNNGMGSWYYGEVVTIVGNDLSSNSEDYAIVVKKPVTSGSSYSYYSDYSEWQRSRSVLSSKDYLYILTRTASYGSNSTAGNTIFRIQPFDSTTGDFRLGTVAAPRSANLDMEAANPTTGSYPVAASNSIWVTTLATTLKDNIVNLVGRDLTSDSFEKVFGTINGSGTYNASPITNTRYTALTIVRL